MNNLVEREKQYIRNKLEELLEKSDSSSAVIITLASKNDNRWGIVNLAYGDFSMRDVYGVMVNSGDKIVDAMAKDVKERGNA